MHVYKITFLKEFMDRICNLRTNSEYCLKRIRSWS